MTATHLGGYVQGGDAATWFPDLWRWLVEERGVRSVIDVGCGEGQALNYFRDALGCQAIGVDGVPQNDPYIVEHDYTTGPLDYALASDQAKDVAAGLNGRFDLAWCCEFIEHVEERYLLNFASSFLLAPLVLLTHAEPGQGGHHHVNCRPAVYWVAVMAGAGFQVEPTLTAETRKLAAMNKSPFNHYARSGIAFVRGG